MIPLQVVIDGLSRPEGEVPPAEVAAALRAGRRVSTSRRRPRPSAPPTPSWPPPGWAAVVSVHLSGGISGTVGAAELAARGGAAAGAGASTPG